MRFSCITAISAICFTLFSCEGVIHLQGNAYDKETSKPLDSVRVVLVLRGNDTIWKNQLQYDTIPYEKRLALRKQNIQDDYNYYDPNGFSKYLPSVSDKSGRFKVGNILVGCVPKCPTCQIVFVKEGYKTLTIKSTSIVQDSIQVYLEKINL